MFTLVCSSEASYQLQTEAGFRDDVRYNNSKVSDLIAPLGVEKSFRGFYHLIDDKAPRFQLALNSENLVEIPVYNVNVTNNAVEMNTAYDSADVEVAYILHQDVMESLIPAPISSVGGLKFDPVSYKGDFRWTNIPDVLRNPDGQIGFFRGIMSSASKPIKTDFGYVILFKRTSTTPAAAAIDGDARPAALARSAGLSSHSCKRWPMQNSQPRCSPRNLKRAAIHSFGPCLAD